MDGDRIDSDSLPDVNRSAASVSDCDPVVSADLPVYQSQGLTAFAVVRQRLGLPHFGYALAWTFILMLLQMVLGLLVFAGGVIVHSMKGGGLDSAMLESLYMKMIPIQITAGTLSLLLFAVGVARLMLGPDFWRQLGFARFSLAQLAITVALVPPLQILAMEVSNWASEYFRPLSEEAILSFAELQWPVVLIVMCVLPGLGEEIFFRGFLSRGLVAHHGIIFGTFLTSLLFAFLHIDPVQASGAFVLGLALQYVFLTTQSLQAPIVLHILNNALAFAVLRLGDVLPIPGVTQVDSERVLHISWPILLVAALTTSLLFWLLYACRTRQSAGIANESRQWVERPGPTRTLGDLG